MRPPSIDETRDRLTSPGTGIRGLDDLVDFGPPLQARFLGREIVVWKATAMTTKGAARVMVSGDDSGTLKVHSTLDPRSVGLLDNCPCCMSQFFDLEHVADYHVAFAMECARPGALENLRIPHGDRSSIDAFLLEATDGAEYDEPVHAGAFYGLDVWRVRIRGDAPLAIWVTELGWAAVAFNPLVIASQFATPDQAALFCVGRYLRSIAAAAA